VSRPASCRSDPRGPRTWVQANGLLQASPGQARNEHRPGSAEVSHPQAPTGRNKNVLRAEDNRQGCVGQRLRKIEKEVVTSRWGLGPSCFETDPGRRSFLACPGLACCRAFGPQAPDGDLRLTLQHAPLGGRELGTRQPRTERCVGPPLVVLGLNEVQVLDAPDSDEGSLDVGCLAQLPVDPIREILELGSRPTACYKPAQGKRGTSAALGLLR